MLYPFAREAGFFDAQDGRASINFRVLYQLIKAGDVMSAPSPSPSRTLPKAAGEIEFLTVKGRFWALQKGRIAVEKSWRDAQVPVLFGKALREAAFATNDSGRYWRRSGARSVWGSSSGVLAIIRGPESTMSAALSGGDWSEERNASSASRATPSTGTFRSIIVVSAC